MLPIPLMLSGYLHNDSKHTVTTSRRITHIYYWAIPSCNLERAAAISFSQRSELGGFPSLLSQGFPAVSFTDLVCWSHRSAIFIFGGRDSEFSSGNKAFCISLMSVSDIFLEIFGVRPGGLEAPSCAFDPQS